MEHTHAKMIDRNTVEFPPVNDNTRGIINYYTDTELLAADGYLPFQGATYPSDGKNYETYYEIVDGVIVQKYEEIIPEPYVDPMTPEEHRRQHYQMLTDGMEAELAYKTRKGYPAEELQALEAQIDECRAQIKQMFPDVVEEKTDVDNA